RLTFRTYSTGEVWEYQYYDDPVNDHPDALYQLKAVVDQTSDPTALRKLVLRYHSNMTSQDTGFHIGQLYRVGDQTFDDTNPAQPQGRYIQFDDQRDKVNNAGTIEPGNSSLLTWVRDVRGKEWTYAYYG